MFRFDCFFTKQRFWIRRFHPFALDTSDTGAGGACDLEIPTPFPSTPPILEHPEGQDLATPTLSHSTPPIPHPEGQDLATLKLFHSTPSILEHPGNQDRRFQEFFTKYHRYRSIRRARFGDSNTFSLTHRYWSIRSQDLEIPTLFHSTPPILEHPWNQDLEIPTLFRSTPPPLEHPESLVWRFQHFFTNTTDTGIRESGLAIPILLAQYH